MMPSAGDDTSSEMLHTFGLLLEMQYVQVRSLITFTIYSFTPVVSHKFVMRHRVII